MQPVAPPHGMLPLPSANGVDPRINTPSVPGAAVWHCGTVPGSAVVRFPKAPISKYTAQVSELKRPIFAVRYGRESFCQQPEP
jgi:hypothetical protein